MKNVFFVNIKIEKNLLNIYILFYKMLRYLNNDISRTIAEINKINTGVVCLKDYKIQLKNAKSELYLSRKLSKKSKKIKQDGPEVTPEEKIIVKENLVPEVMPEYKNINLGIKDFTVQIGEQQIKVNIKIYRIKNSYKKINLSYKPYLNFLNSTSNKGEYIAYNFATINLCKALVCPNTTKRQRIKIAKALSKLWD